MFKSNAVLQRRFLVAGVVIVLIWFFTRMGLHEKIQEHAVEIYSQFAPTKAPDDYFDTHPTGPTGPSSFYDEGRHPDLLEDAEAEQLCSNFRLPVFPRERMHKRKVYDLLLVNTELEMLEIRMGQMAPYVDYFVILESDKTFTDHPKPLYVKDNWDRFAPWHNQMIRRTMDLSGEFSGTWDREISSRNAMYTQVIPSLTGEQAASIDDVLLVADIDEIYKPETVRVLRNCEAPQRVTAHSRMFYYSFQWLNDPNWNHPQATTYQGKDTVLPDDLRNDADEYVFNDGAWHCSYCFSSIKEMVSKITSFSHTEFDRPEMKEPKNIIRRVRNGIDAFDRYNCTRVERNYDVPDYIKTNHRRYGYMLDRDPDNANFKDYDAVQHQIIPDDTTATDSQPKGDGGSKEQDTPEGAQDSPELQSKA